MKLFTATLTLAAVRGSTVAAAQALTVQAIPAVTPHSAGPSAADWGQGQGPSAGLHGAARLRSPLAPSRRLLQLDCETVQIETVQGRYCLSYYDQTLGQQPYLWACGDQDKAQQWLW